MKMTLDVGKKEGSGWDLICKAGSVLNAAGKKKEAQAIHAAAQKSNYSFYKALKLLKKFGLT